MPNTKKQHNKKMHSFAFHARFLTSHLGPLTSDLCNSSLPLPPFQKKKNGENLIGARKERKLKEQEASTNELMSKRRSRRRGCNPNTTSTKQPPQHRINQLTVSFHSSVVFLFPFPPLFFVHLFDIGDLGTGDTH